MQRSGVMLSLEKNLGMLCPWNGPVAGSEKQPTGVKPRMLKTEEVVLVVVKRVVVVDEEVVGGGVEDEDEDVEVLLGVERVEDDEDEVEETVEDEEDVVETVEDEEDVEETVEDELDVLSDVEDVELEDVVLEVDEVTLELVSLELVAVELAEVELVDTSVEVELADEEISDEVEELTSIVDEDDGTLAELELDVELVLLRAELLELDTTRGVRLLYIDSLDPPPHYPHQLVFNFIYFSLKGYSPVHSDPPYTSNCTYCPSSQ